ncbi:MAG: ABC transporter substrate-binding protein [Burkholderiales bacterium]|nr:tripartite tricarboxylate transporter substrate binding protein [Burkholderiaceae bacterium]
MPSVRRILATLLLLLGIPFAAQAQNYPTRPVKMVVSFAAGGPIDQVARIVAAQLTEKLGQPFVVENRTGANGAIAADAVKNSEPDGHTILVTNASMITITPTLVKNLRYDPERDFEPVTRIVASPLVMVVNPENPQTASVKSVADLVALAKRSPGQIAYGSAGPNGNVTQLAFELFSDIAGIKLVHVPYKGSSEAQAAVLGQQVALAFDTMSAVPHVKAGKLRPLAASSMQRIAAFPDLPTMNELGYKNFDIGFWSGIFVPKNTPPAVIEKLNRAIVEVSKDPAIQPKLEMHGTIVTSSPEEFRAHIKTETSTLAEVIRRANISVQ